MKIIAYTDYIMMHDDKSILIDYNELKDSNYPFEFYISNKEGKVFGPFVMDKTNYTNTNEIKKIDYNGPDKWRGTIFNFKNLDYMHPLESTVLNKDNVKIGMNVTLFGYYDSYFYTILDISKNKAKITLQKNKAIRLTIPQHNSGDHCANNNDIKYYIIPDDNEGIISINSEKNGEYYWNNKPVMIGRSKCYD